MAGQAMRTSSFAYKRNSLVWSRKWENSTLRHMTVHTNNLNNRQGKPTAQLTPGCSSGWGKPWNDRLARYLTGRSKGWDKHPHMPGGLESCAPVQGGVHAQKRPERAFILVRSWCHVCMQRTYKRTQWKVKA